MTTSTPEPTTAPTPEALAFYHRELLPWLMRYSTTPSVQHDAEGAMLVSAFAQAAVERERERLGNCPKCGSEGYGYEDDDNVESCIDCGHRGKL